ncbi:hypothetical protein PUN4_130097 [Paraburkholderia unamae]|nr:hypothetical protein PUN4_130097 [Paraburkholderia unamae]
MHYGMNVKYAINIKVIERFGGTGNYLKRNYFFYFTAV